MTNRVAKFILYLQQYSYCNDAAAVGRQSPAPRYTVIVGTRTGYNTYSYECSVSNNLQVREPRTEVPRPLN